MEEQNSFSDADDYIRQVDKFPEKIDFSQSLNCVEYYRKTLFEVCGFIFVDVGLKGKHSAMYTIGGYCQHCKRQENPLVYYVIGRTK